MYDYALCKRNFTRRSQDGMTIPASGRIHVKVAQGEEPTCPECIELAKTKPQPTVERLEDNPPATGLTWAQKVVIIGSPKNLKWLADKKRRRELEAMGACIDPNENDEDDDNEEESEGEIEEQL
jgi:hypothetical protein